jgi:hypothetical protein
MAIEKASVPNATATNKTVASVMVLPPVKSRQPPAISRQHLRGDGQNVN